MKYWTLSDDPHAEREAQKYDNPAPSREYLLAALESYGKPITHENMSRMLGIEDEEHLEAVRRRRERHPSKRKKEAKRWQEERPPEERPRRVVSHLHAEELHAERPQLVEEEAAESLQLVEERQPADAPPSAVQLQSEEKLLVAEDLLSAVQHLRDAELLVVRQ